MKRAFTLIEMMIVIAILAILMTITFRLTSSGEEDKKRANTIVKMQKIENCLSGYYAAFGSYPPVKVHGWLDIYHEVDAFGDQLPTRKEGVVDEDRVLAACRVQPFGCEYPPEGLADDGEEDEEGEAKKNTEAALVKSWAKKMAERARENKWVNYRGEKFNAFREADLTAPTTSTSFNDVWSTTDAEDQISDWREGVRLFKFGVMSFLLPRYSFMMRSGEGWFGHDSETGKGGGAICLQWANNNDMPCDPLEGESYGKKQKDSAKGWMLIKKRASSTENGKTKDAQTAKIDRAGVDNIPAQAACARWMPNLQGLCMTTKANETFFGINISAPYPEGPAWTSKLDRGVTLKGNEEYGFFPTRITPVHYPPDRGTPYCNGCITIVDGWGQEFFYYSPSPYQSYVLWSAGSNGKTFPPWGTTDALPVSDRKKVLEWMVDDIKCMSEGR